jgi:hypothetical protein
MVRGMAYFVLSDDIAENASPGGLARAVQMKPRSSGNRPPLCNNEGDCQAELGDTTAARHGPEPVVIDEPQVSSQVRPRLLVAVPDAALRTVLSSLLDALDPLSISEVADGSKLDHA